MSRPAACRSETAWRKRFVRYCRVWPKCGSPPAVREDDRRHAETLDREGGPAGARTSLRVWPMIAASRSVALVPAPTSRWTFSSMVIASITSRIGSFPSCGSFSAVSRQAAALFCPGEGACCCPAASCCRVGSAARSVPVTAVVSASISAQCIHAFRLISNQKGKIVAGCRGAGVRVAFCRIAGLTGFPSSLFTIPVVAPDSVGTVSGSDSPPDVGCPDAVICLDFRRFLRLAVSLL